MASQQFLPEILWLTMILLAPHGSDAVQKAGNLASNQVSDVMNQICPSDNPFRRTHVRIKTFNGKYWHATPSMHCWRGEQSLCVKTRCCGAKPSMHQKDIKEPGRRTTFKVHCKRYRKKEERYHVAQFEVLNNNDNNPSKYFLCNQEDVSHTYTRHIPGSHALNSDLPGCSWILHNYRGSVIGLEPFDVWKWTTFDDSDYGIVRHGMYKKRSWPWSDIDHGTRVANRRTPYLDDTYTLEIVPQECLDVADNQKIQAAKSDATVEQCEESPDRCFMNNGWTNRNTDHPSSSGPKCFYRKGALCFQPNVASRQDCEDQDTRTPEKCETANANCCFDYSRRKCYQALSE